MAHLPRYKSHEELDAMRALKPAYDPKNILNPGKTDPAGVAAIAAGMTWLNRGGIHL